MKSTKKPSLGALWPSVDTAKDAQKAAHQGIWAALIIAVITTLIVAGSLYGLNILNTGTSAMYDVILFIAIAYGIFKMSKIAAVAGLVLYIFETIYMTAITGGSFSFVSLLFILFFINSVRGVFAYHNLKGEKRK